MRKTSELLWQDAQHQVLFELLDMIREPGSGEEVLDRLRDYAETHFALEEHYMAELDFPGRADHVRAHDRFRSEVDSLLRSREAGSMAYDDNVRQVVATYLSEWLKCHVFGVDKELETFVLSSPVK